MQVIKCLITGNPGVGKSTLVKQIIDRISEQGITVGGIITPELRERGIRIGFLIVDLFNKKESIMASTNIRSPYRVSKYFVDLHVVEKIGISALINAAQYADVIVIDEIGKMELLSKKFESTLFEVFKVEKPIIATIGRYYVKHIYKKVKAIDSRVTLYELTRENFNEILQKILKNLV